MRSGLRPVRPVLVPALAALCLVSLAGAPADAAASKRRRPPAPPAGFSVDLARIEPLTPDGTVQAEGVGEYRGVLELRRTPGGVGVVNEVPLEDYLKGIAEMPAGWPAEALRAQAIAARTYALWTLGAGPGGEAAALAADICATEGCQVYAGLGKERAPNGRNWVSAVEATRGQVLLHQGKPILAKYSSSNGGRSVAGGRPYLKPVDDPDDARSPLHRWQLTLTYDDVGRALAVPGPVTGVARAGGDVVVEWGSPAGAPAPSPAGEEASNPPADPAGDGGTGGGTGAPDGESGGAGPGGGAGDPGGDAAAGPPATGRVAVPATQFRSKINATVPPPPGRSRTVPSPMFSLRSDPVARVAVLEGRGYGHGIGMSQYGAYGKAQRGLNAAAILAAYYGGIRPVTLPPANLPAAVRVAIEPGRPEVVGGASTPFRVVDGKGRVVAAVATGAWRAVPGPKGGLRLLPPPGQTGPVALELIGIEPPSPSPGEPAVVRFRPTVPALVRVVAQPPGGVEAEVMASRPAAPEEVSVTLPPAAQPGAYVVWITADAGGDRSGQLALVPQVKAPPGTAPKWSPPGRPGPDALMSRLLAGVSAAATPEPRRAGRAGRSTGAAAAAALAASAAVALALVVRSHRRRPRLEGGVEERPEAGT